jgi:hypothetical protein
MAEILQLSRNTKLFIKDTQSDAVGSGQMWEIPILDGYSFSQGTESTEVMLSEAADASNNSRRGKAVFNTALAPVEWSITTYVRPFKGQGSMVANNWRWDGSGGANNTHMVDEALWAYFAAGSHITFQVPNTTANSLWSNTFVTSNTTSELITFAQSNKTALRVFEMYFVLGANAPGGAGPYTTYKLVDSCVNSATIDFDIEGIAQVQWSGYAKQIVTSNTNPKIANTISEANTSTNTFIRNRLTTMNVATSAAQQAAPYNLSATYSLVVTGGSITLENNITYLTPEELAIVNIPLGHVTGNRSVSGTFKAYLNDDQAANSTGKLYKDMANAVGITTHDFNLTFNIGGAGTPRLVFNLPKAHMEIPTHSIDDVIGVEFTFSGLPSSLGNTDEATILAVGPIYS